MFPRVSFTHHLSHSTHGALVKDFSLQSGSRRVGLLLQITEVWVLLLLAFSLFTNPVRAQVLSRRCLDVPHQLSIAPVWLLLSPPPLLLLFPQPVLLPTGFPLLVSRNNGAMERTLVAVLSLTQLAVAQRSPAVMADRGEPPRKGDVPALALCQQLLILHLLVHFSVNPELMLRGRLDDLAGVGLLLTPVVQIQTKRHHRSIDGLLL